jgi:glycerate 2-kinase
VSQAPTSLREDALAIWQAGVQAVDSSRLVRNVIQHDQQRISIAGIEIPAAAGGSVVVVGAGKAGSGMATGLEEGLGDGWLDRLRLQGWVNVPADCVRPLKRIRLHAARPAGVNEPTSESLQGTAEIIRMISQLGPQDTCICLLSGGGSALLAAPVEGVSLADKQQLARILSGAGANIAELNTVRKQLSQVKGGRLAKACGAGQLITLVISDVLGDPLEMIASGPTVADSSTVADALAVLRRFDSAANPFPASVWEYLERVTAVDVASQPGQQQQQLQQVIGNNRTAVEAAAEEARRRGWQVSVEANEELEGAAEAVGQRLAGMFDERPAEDHCFISGGEPVVELVAADRRGSGGRNQQLVLAAVADRLGQGADFGAGLLMSAGTDGEDGPTDAAGAWVDKQLLAEIQSRQLDPQPFLDRNDAYHFFEPLGGLIQTGPTHTNVCDLRIVLRRAD